MNLSGKGPVPASKTQVPDGLNPITMYVTDVNRRPEVDIEVSNDGVNYARMHYPVTGDGVTTVQIAAAGGQTQVRGWVTTDLPSATGTIVFAIA